MATLMDDNDNGGGLTGTTPGIPKDDNEAESNHNAIEASTTAPSATKKSIWDDEYVERFTGDNNNKGTNTKKTGWQCQWCNMSFAGEANPSKCLAHLTRTPGKHIKICCAAIPPAKVAEYRQLQLEQINRNRAKKGLPEIGLEGLPTPVQGDKPVGPRTFDESVEKLREYKTKHGNCAVPRSYPDDKALGEWVVKQRQHQRKLSPEQRRQLEELGFVFESRQEQQNQKWQSMLEEAKAYKEEKGHFKIGKRRQKENEKLKQLARWMNYQRAHRKKGNLEQDRVDKLTAIGFDWTTHAEKSTETTTTKTTTRPPNASHEEQWQEKYNKLADFQKKNGHCNLLTTHEDQSLYFWLKRQRSIFHKKQLREDRRLLLDKLGVVWDPKGEDALQAAWDAQYQHLLEYRKEHGGANVPHRYQKNALGTWVASQKRFFRDGVMDPHRATRLLEAGLPIVMENERSWNSRYEQLQAKETWQDVTKDCDLERWTRLQHVLKTYKELGNDRLLKLEEIRFQDNARILSSPVTESTKAKQNTEASIQNLDSTEQHDAKMPATIPKPPADPVTVTAVPVDAASATARDTTNDKVGATTVEEPVITDTVPPVVPPTLLPAPATPTEPQPEAKARARVEHVFQTAASAAVAAAMEASDAPNTNLVATPVATGGSAPAPASTSNRKRPRSTSKSPARTRFSRRLEESNQRSSEAEGSGEVTTV